MELGVCFQEEPVGILVYLWGWGGRGGEEAITRILGDLVVARSRDWGGDAGTVALARIPIPDPVAHQFEIDRQPLIVAVEKAIQSLTRSHIDAVLGVQPLLKAGQNDPK